MRIIPYQLVMIIVAKNVDGGVDVKFERFNFDAPSEAIAAQQALEKANVKTAQVSVTFATVRNVMVEAA